MVYAPVYVCGGDFEDAHVRDSREREEEPLFLFARAVRARVF